MQLLVTGGLGFIGSNFILKMLKEIKDLSIINVDAEYFGSNHKNLDELKNSLSYKFVKGDITNKKLMENLISDCDCVINFAAESHVDRSILEPSPFLDSNINGAFTILDIIKNQKKRFIQISTDEVFGSISTGSAVENSRYNPSSPYAATKACAELLINSYIITHDVDCITTRCTNNYGPRQSPEKFIPKIIMLAKKNKKIPIYGDGKNVRDWMFVDDHCDAIYKVLLNGKSGNSYNISANNELDNLTIVKKILELMGKSLELIEFVDDRPGHDLRYSLDSSKIRNELNYSPQVTFDRGLNKTIEWYLSNTEWCDNISDELLKSTPWKN